MMHLQLTDAIEDKVGNAILISGSARSGTTILGKIIHSFRNVEYAFEPPTIISLLTLIDDIPLAAWKILYETYLYEDFLLGSLAGRGINTNTCDDSSIFRVKSEYDVQSRLNSSHRKVQLQEQAKKAVIAYKIPDIIPYIPKLLEIYPLTRVVILRRDATETINSLMKKNWFSDANLRANVVWPFHIGEGKIPYWVKKSDLDKWRGMDELDRCAYYYVRMHQDMEKINNKIEISYERLLSDPSTEVQLLAQQLDVTYGEKTEELIASVQPTKSDRDMSILKKISPDLLNMIKMCDTGN